LSWAVEFGGAHEHHTVKGQDEGASPYLGQVLGEAQECEPS